MRTIHATALTAAAAVGGFAAGWLGRATPTAPAPGPEPTRVELDFNAVPPTSNVRGEELLDRLDKLCAERDWHWTITVDACRDAYWGARLRIEVDETEAPIDTLKVAAARSAAEAIEAVAAASVTWIETDAAESIL